MIDGQADEQQLLESCSGAYTLEKFGLYIFVYVFAVQNLLMLFCV